MITEILSCDDGESINFPRWIPYYPETLPGTSFNYMNERQEENERYDITSQI